MPIPVTGDHTASEVADLYRVYVYEVTVLDAAQEQAKAWSSPAAAAWRADWQTFKTAWAAQVADTGLMRVLELAGEFPDEPSEYVWTKMRTTYNGGELPPDLGGTEGASSYPALCRRYMTAAAHDPSVTPIDWTPGVPKPTATDYQLATYQVASSAVHAIERARDLATDGLSATAIGVLIGVFLALRYR
jgi:hypothetical protein